MKYKIGDKVMIKSIDWYNSLKDKNGNIPSLMFLEKQSILCGKEVTINFASENIYGIEEDKHFFFGDCFENYAIGASEEKIKEIQKSSDPTDDDKIYVFIKGNPHRYKEVIAELEKRGGYNSKFLTGGNKDAYYYISPDDYIIDSIVPAEDKKTASFIFKFFKEIHLETKCPKFKVNNWVKRVTEDKNVHIVKITKFESNEYYFSDGTTLHVDLEHFIEKYEPQYAVMIKCAFNRFYFDKKENKDAVELYYLYNWDPNISKVFGTYEEAEKYLSDIKKTLPSTKVFKIKQLI